MKTGGLETSIAAHVVNNLLAYTTATLTGTVAQIRGINDITWPNAAVDIGGFATFAVLAWLASKRMNVTPPPGSAAGHPAPRWVAPEHGLSAGHCSACRCRGVRSGRLRAWTARR